MKRFWADLSDIFQERERKYIVWNDEAQFFSGLRGGKPVFSESYDDRKSVVYLKSILKNEWFFSWVRC
jgi:hypothetical protein